MVRCLSRCSALENGREHDGHVWLGLADCEIILLRIVGDESEFDLFDDVDGLDCCEWPGNDGSETGEAAIVLSIQVISVYSRLRKGTLSAIESAPLQ